MQKLMRVAIGNNNVDNCSRLCHAPSAAGLVASFGLSGGTQQLRRLRPRRLLPARRLQPDRGPSRRRRPDQAAGDPRRRARRRRPAADRADRVRRRPPPGPSRLQRRRLQRARPRPARGRLRRGVLPARARRRARPAARRFSTSSRRRRSSEISGVPAADLRRAAHIYGEAAGAGDRLRARRHRALPRHRRRAHPREPGDPHRQRRHSARRRRQPAARPEQRPGRLRHGRAPRPAARDTSGSPTPRRRARFERAWGVEIRREPGLRIPRDVRRGALGGAEGALRHRRGHRPDRSRQPTTSRRRCEACELVVSQEIFLSRTAERADVVLPGAPFLEKDGTFVNFDRRFQRVRPALAPPGEARTDFDVLNGVAAAIGTDLGCPTPAAAMDECASLAPLFAGISHDRLDREGPLHWPCAIADDPGEPASLPGELRHRRTAAPSLHAQPYLPPGEQPDDEFPFVLVTGRRLVHYNAGTMTRRTDNLVLLPEERLEIHPDRRRAARDPPRGPRRGRRAGAGRWRWRPTSPRRSRPGAVHGLPLPRGARERAHLGGDRRGDRLPGVQGDRGPSEKGEVS